MKPKKRKMNGLNNIKKELEIKNTYVSKFDFESFEIKEEDKLFLIDKEKFLTENGKKYNESLFNICKSLFEVSEKLKDHKQGTFMKWYENINLNKDKVSELLKRYSLYEEREDLRPYISGLSGLAIRILTHKTVTKEIRSKIFEGKLTSTNDIRETILLEMDTPVEEKSDDEVKRTRLPFYDSIFSFEKKIKKINKDEVKGVLIELEELEKEMKRLKKILIEKENTEK